MLLQSYPGLWHRSKYQLHRMLRQEYGKLKVTLNNLVRPCFKKHQEVCGCTSVVENLSNVCEALASILSIAKGSLKVASDPSILFTRETVK